MACHAVDRKLVGPAYKDVAAKYAGQKDAAAKLAEKIMKGGVGAWGPVPMPANPQVSPTEAKKLAHWVLTLEVARHPARLPGVAEALARAAASQRPARPDQ